MSMPTEQNYRALEQTRQRLNQLTIQLDTLLRELADVNQPLPSWPSLHAHSSILAQNIATLTTHLESNAAFFDSAVVFPRPSFPPEHQPLLEGLLGKKLGNDVQDWVSEGKELGAEDVSMKGEQWKELWEWAAMAGNEEARKHEWGVNEESEDDEEEEEGKLSDPEGLDKMDTTVETNGDATVVPLSTEQWLKYLTKGELPVR